jgi:hypothetical protein
VSAAQSRGEKPGSRTGRVAPFFGGLSVTCVGARELLVLVGRLPGGTRRDAAAEGGGLSMLLLPLGLPPSCEGKRPAGGARVFCCCGCGCLCGTGARSREGGGGGGMREASFAAGACIVELGLGSAMAGIDGGEGAMIGGDILDGSAVIRGVSCCTF